MQSATCTARAPPGACTVRHAATSDSSDLDDFEWPWMTLNGLCHRFTKRIEEDRYCW